MKGEEKMNEWVFGNIKFKDWCEAIVFDKCGEIKQIHKGEDLITSAGKAAVAALILNDVAEDDFDYVAIGSGSTAASTSDTTLEKEAIRATATGTRVTTSATNDTAQLVYQFASGKPSGFGATDSTGVRNIVESAVLNSGAGGDLLCRQTFAALNCDWPSGDTLQITWKIQTT